MPALPRAVALLFLLALTALPTRLVADPALPAPFQPPGMWIWDNWFAHDGQRWHAFYLQLPKAVGPDRRWKDNDPYKHVGHAVSENLSDWRDAGPALCALSGTWNDRHIATGSIVHHAGRWWMFFTGRGRRGDGVGLALSDDLTVWKTEPQPLFPLCDTFAERGAGVFQSQWEGRPLRWIGISDPYVHPLPLDGWFYLVLCARAVDAPLAESGCLAMVRSRDLRRWEPAGIVSWPRCFERMETPQIWPHADRWWVSFGGVLNMPWVKRNQARLPTAVRGQRSHQNYCCSLARFDAAARNDDIRHIAAPAGSYIMKVLPQPSSPDLALFTCTDARGTCLSAPYDVEYQSDGGLKLALHAQPEKQ